MDRAGRNIGMLQQLMEAGMQLAQAAADRALQAIKAPPPAPDEPGQAQSRGPDHTQVFLRLFAAIRQTMALQARLVRQQTDLPAEAIQPEPPAPPAPGMAQAPAKPLPPLMEKVRQDLARRRAANARGAAVMA
jgi:hypothetical protein